MSMSAVKGYDRDLYQMFADALERGISYEWCIRYPDFDLKAEALSHFQILMESIQEVK